MARYRNPYEEGALFSKQELIDEAAGELSGEPVSHWPDNVLELYGLNVDSFFSGSEKFTHKAVTAVAQALDAVLLHGGKVLLVREVCLPETFRLPRIGSKLGVADIGIYWSWTTARWLGDPCKLENPDDVYWRITAELSTALFSQNSNLMHTLVMSTLDPFGYEREIILNEDAELRIMDVEISREDLNYTKYHSGTAWGDSHPTYMLGPQFEKLVVEAFGFAVPRWR